MRIKAPDLGIGLAGITISSDDFSSDFNVEMKRSGNLSIKSVYESQYLVVPNIAEEDTFFIFQTIARSILSHLIATQFQALLVH